MNLLYIIYLYIYVYIYIYIQVAVSPQCILYMLVNLLMSSEVLCQAPGFGFGLHGGENGAADPA